ncbi:SH3 domain-containing protein [Rhodospira trueperi]|uniref:SH3 domain-containing protein n=1 Tax=Rhodospira trueperi TaxID=69960 RepID=UPI001FE22EB2|nr:SH3 domain-containing protein [Rhodospira trueperi]
MALSACLALPPVAATAQDQDTVPDPTAEADAPTLGPSGLPLPRFASLGSDHINMRTGPGTRYPVTWVYKRQGLPVEVVQETNDWRRVRDPDGDEGWVHKVMLSNSARMALVSGATPAVLLRQPDAAAEGIAEIEAGALVKVLQCPENSDHCRVEAQRFQGWLPRAALWGLLPDEEVD